MTSIRIVTDSTSDIPKDLAAELGITIVPVYINIGDRSYLDGVELSRAEFYQRLPTYRPFPQTSTPGVNAFKSTYESLIAGGANYIYSIHVAGSLSSLLDTARLAARSISQIPVTVVDSESLSLGLGFLAMAAARAARAGRSAVEISALLQERLKHTFVIAALDTVEYLRRSGRASFLQSRLATFLKIFPVLSIYRGLVSLERIRTRMRSLEHLVQSLQEKAPLLELAILHTACQEKAEALRTRVAHLVPQTAQIILTEVTPAIGAHVGPNGVGIACVQRE